jgi:aerobic-type carbon monoxide dehydrogenase small subunit (CoxS/CutS family)
MDKTITFTVNGKSRTVTTDPERPLLDVLREDLQLTGAKYGCGEGQCRACTVLLNGKSVASCLTPIGDVEKQTVLTIEGLADGNALHPVQEAFLAEGAFQCGYCTSGFIMGTVGLLKENPKPTRDEILARLQRHLCRCCSYPNILRAAERAAGAVPGSAGVAPASRQDAGAPR